MGLRDESEPLRAGLPVRTPVRGPVLVAHPLFGLPVGIRPAVDGTGEQPIDGAVARPAPGGRAPRRVRGELQAVLQEPPEGLPDRAQLGERPEHQGDGLLDPAVRVLFQPLVLGLHIADRHGLEERPAPRLGVAGFHGALAQEVQLVLVQAALQAQEEPIVALPGRVDHLLVDQDGVDDPADFHQLLPLAAVAREAGDLPGGHGAHLAQADLRDHALEPRAGDRPGGRPAQVLIHDLDLAPPQLPKPILHGGPGASGSPGCG